MQLTSKVSSGSIFEVLLPCRIGRATPGMRLKSTGWGVDEWGIRVFLPSFPGESTPYGTF
jgi:hypothetical protein